MQTVAKDLQGLRIERFGKRVACNSKGELAESPLKKEKRSPSSIEVLVHVKADGLKNRCGHMAPTRVVNAGDFNCWAAGG
mmetsp:Transcript_113831/g.179150  ORF Transcript_113831/g.179150 Transcript_113831/m.179150 type:complete len:80 (-) Transcript_113831:2089-2328(-)